MERGDTIAAIATAPGRGGVAVIRVSGPEAFAVATRICRKTPRPGRIQFTRFFAIDQSIDEGLLLSFQSPHSYTGEDVVEFQCHGGCVTPRRILEACFAAGARLARRGEFTERAFLNGRLALDQAEAVLDLIDAKTDRAADLAFQRLAQREGPATEGDLQQIYDRALELSSTIEHALDVDEGELPASFSADVLAAIDRLRMALNGAWTRARERALLRQGVLVVLAGPPNAGKSSLLNALAGTDRAIVSDVPGTTRDAVEVWLDLEGWPVRLVDTAGLRATADAIEAEGVRRSEALIAAAAVVLDLGVGNLPAGKTIRLHAKCDLARGEGLNVSSVTGEGLDELRRALVAKLAAQAASFSEDVGDARAAVCHETLALLDALPSPPRSSTLDLVLAGNILQRVCAKLGAELGATYSEDLLDRLFSRFCVGK
ncbi:MAG: tRNA uridine-5-carboxymethylaminomethyl(34) synthesis GTPase MnmE [Kiritimatiellia bacterium]